MAMNKTRYGRQHVLDHMFGRVEHAFPTEVWAALFTADPTELGTLTDEVTETGYARVEVVGLLSDADLATGVITNSALIEFGPATEDWPEITHIGFMDSATIGAGNMTYYGPAVTSRLVDSGDSLKIQIGQLTIQEL